MVSKEDDCLIAPAVGSCLVITMHEHILKIGGMIHAMLPHSKDSFGSFMLEEIPDGKYVDIAIDLALEKMKAFGGEPENIEAKVVGGANMFGLYHPDIGKDNFLSAKKKLREVGVKLTRASIGGSIGRSVEFSVFSGIVKVILTL